MKALKATNHNYIAYHPLHMKESLITKGFRKLPGCVSIAIDGASHDSHQHHELIRAVDLYLLDETMDLLYPYLDIDVIRRPEVEKMVYMMNWKI